MPLAFELPYYLSDEEKVRVLYPGESISARVDLDLWAVRKRPGDYAITTPVFFGGNARAQSFSRYFISNTWFIRILPKGRKVTSDDLTKFSKSRFAIQINAADRRVKSNYSPLKIGADTYLPAQVAAALVRGKLDQHGTDTSIVRDGTRLRLDAAHGVAVLPSGKRIHGVAIPQLEQQELMVPVSLLTSVFGAPKKVSWRIDS
jgi:hypothetical protein